MLVAAIGLMMVGQASATVDPQPLAKALQRRADGATCEADDPRELVVCGNRFGQVAPAQ